MSHLDEQALVSLHYGDAPEADRAHLVGCLECRQALEALSHDLAQVVAEDAPPRPEGYEAELWERLAPRLRTARIGGGAGRMPRVWTFAALAAALVVAFVSGRYSVSPVPGPSPAQDVDTGERVLLVAIGDHLERTEVLLLELTNADPARGDASAAGPRASAETLLATNRLVRQSASLAGDAAVTEVLDELERVLADAAHEGAAGAELASLRRRIDRRGLLFRVRVLGARVREREREKPAAAGADTL